jgi:3-oxoacyl-[acyl-carrier protein] reductase/pteridine reductase
MQIAGRTALITGGAHRVGKAITLALAAQGAHVVINYNRSSAEAQATLDTARTLGTDGMIVRADVSDHAAVQAMMSAAHDRFGGVDILVNSASWFQPTPLPTDDLSDWYRVTRILIDGALHCANAAAPLMQARGEGAIVNIVDLSAWQPAPGFAAHSVGKAGLLALTRQLALEFAPQITVNAVAPGPVLPPSEFTAEQREAVARQTLLGRWGTAEDVADAVIFLVRASFITGECITVDGGQQHAASKCFP